MKDYHIVEKRYVQDIASEAILYEHRQSGAKLMALGNQDASKVFTACFKTPPFDDTGLFHILEHCVLAGSRKYSVKEPFNELNQGSLYTYLNAMTYGDRTVYPVGSRHDKDFLHMMDVYLDAVFFPKITERPESFRQEGWHYKYEREPGQDEAENKGILTLNGIVYSEMKGAYSDPLRLLDRLVNQALFPGTHYRFDAGGYPGDIPSLSYEAFLDAHRRYYHPANCMLLLYGDMDTETCLSHIHEGYLRHFDCRDGMAPAIPPQSPLHSPCFVQGDYAAGKGDEDKKILSASFVLDVPSSPEAWYGYKLLCYILMGTAASPLKKKLTDAALGQEVLGWLDSEQLQPVLHIVIRNAHAGMETFQRVLSDEVSRLCAEGFDDDLVQACFHKTEFLYREEDYGYRPKGLHYHLTALSGWLYGENPFDRLERLHILEQIRQRCRIGGYFEHMLRQGVRDNTHCAYAELRPRAALRAEAERVDRERFCAIRDSLSQAEREALEAQTKALEDYQNRQDTEDDLMKMPFLLLSDVPAQPERIPFLWQGNVSFSPMETNDIDYGYFLFDTSHIEQERLPLIGLLAWLLGKMPTKRYSYEALGTLINDRMGGFGAESACYRSATDMGMYRPGLAVKAKWLSAKRADAQGLMEEILAATRFDDGIRLKTLLQELKSKLSIAFLTRGDKLALTRAEAGLAPAGWYQDMTRGIGFYQYICQIAEDFAEESQRLSHSLELLARDILQAGTLHFHGTCGPGHVEGLGRAAEAIRGGLATKTVGPAPILTPLSYGHEGFFTSGMVQYNALWCPYGQSGLTYDGNLHLAMNILENLYLTDELRIKGGAYGLGAKALPGGGFHFYSYRDPHLARTYRVYEQAADFLASFQASEFSMRKHILGTINKLDRPITPQAKGELALRRHLCGRGYENLCIEREQILGATPERLRIYGEDLRACLPQGRRCAVGGKAIARKAEALFHQVWDMDM